MTKNTNFTTPEKNQSRLKGMWGTSLSLSKLPYSLRSQMETNFCHFFKMSIQLFCLFQDDADKVGRFLKKSNIEGWISRVLKTVRHI